VRQQAAATDSRHRRIGTKAMLLLTVKLFLLPISLSVDRDMWLERHGIALPPSFPVVQVIMGSQ